MGPIGELVRRFAGEGGRIPQEWIARLSPGSDADEAVKRAWAAEDDGRPMLHLAVHDPAPGALGDLAREIAALARPLLPPELATSPGAASDAARQSPSETAALALSAIELAEAATAAPGTITDVAGQVRDAYVAAEVAGRLARGDGEDLDPAALEEAEAAAERAVLPRIADLVRARIPAPTAARLTEALRRHWAPPANPVEIPF